jgi:hypothetical protein
MKVNYKCEVCDRNYDTVDDCVKCESGHTIIEMKWWWLIPFVGWFMIPFSLFTNKNAIIKPKNWKERLMLDFITTGPILLTLSCILIYIKFFM